MSASECVSGRNRATHVMPTGIAVIGKSEPARNQGAIAIAGRRAMYSSWRGIRLARISAIPYMAMVKPAVAPRNQSTPLVVAWKWMPRATARPSRVAICSPVIATATMRLPKTSSARGTGAARSSRCAPCSRSTITPSPRNSVFSGTSSPTVPSATYDS